MNNPIGRRGFLRAGALASLGIALGAAGTLALQQQGEHNQGNVPAPVATDTPAGENSGAPPPPTTVPGGLVGEIIPFHGEHQAGIITPPQQHLFLAAFDLLVGSKEEVCDLLQLWSNAAARLSTGQPLGDGPDEPRLPPADSGDALGRGAARLTITFGFGPTLFLRDGVDRFGLLALRPAELQDVPPLPGDALDPALSGGDICVQACADDSQVAFHAIRSLTRLGQEKAQLRWVQLGFSHTVGFNGVLDRPRNLFGFKEGTGNLDVTEEQAMAEHVWVGTETEPAWMRNGSYLAIRRIRMLLETWDNSSLEDQENSIGRTKNTGAPLGKQAEGDAVDLQARGDDGQLLVPQGAHVRVALEGGERILRRGYSYSEGIDAGSGNFEAGRIFISFQKSLQEQFIPMLQRHANNDNLNEYITHIGSGVFACPGGAAEGSFVGEDLFT